VFLLISVLHNADKIIYAQICSERVLIILDHIGGYTLVYKKF
jgi:hypothetical protein